jgi:tetratricopeptide (TPR) repeat protein
LKEAKSVVEMMKQFATPTSSDRVQSYYLMIKARFAIESNQWEELLIPTRLNHKDEGKKQIGDLITICKGSEFENNRISSIFATGIAAIKTGNFKEAEVAAEFMNRLRAVYSKDQCGFDEDVLTIQQHSLLGLIELAKGFKDKGLEFLRKAAEAEKQLALPSGPPIPAKPATELYAEALLDQNQAQEALQWFEISLLRTPNRTLSLLGAYHSSKKLKRNLTAKFYLSTLKAMLISADTSIKLLMK